MFSKICIKVVFQYLQTKKFYAGTLFVSAAKQSTITHLLQDFGTSLKIKSQKACYFLQRVVSPSPYVYTMHVDGLYYDHVYDEEHLSQYFHVYDCD